MKTHTSPKCRKYGSLIRCRALNAQYDSAIMVGNYAMIIPRVWRLLEFLHSQDPRPTSTSSSFRISMSLEMGPEHRHLIPEVAIGGCGSGLSSGVCTYLQIGIISGIGRPFWITAAVGIASFGETRPITDYAALNCQVGVRGAVSPLPRE